MSAITIDQAKLYLRIDDTLDAAQEAELQSFIDAAETFIERKTGYILTPKTKTYLPSADGYVRVYDTPITSDTSALDATQKNGYLLIAPGAGVESIDLDVGYATVGEIPQDLINAALQMLKVYFYESEKQENTTLMPANVKSVIWNRKRFII